jgi:hypothetical protein
MLDKVFICLRSEENADYVEKVFPTEIQAREYCEKFTDENDYERYYEEQPVEKEKTCWELIHDNLPTEKVEKVDLLPTAQIAKFRKGLMDLFKITDCTLVIMEHLGIPDELLIEHTPSKVSEPMCGLVEDTKKPTISISGEGTVPREQEQPTNAEKVMYNSNCPQNSVFDLFGMAVIASMCGFNTPRTPYEQCWQDLFNGSADDTDIYTIAEKMRLHVESVRGIAAKVKAIKANLANVPQNA